MRPVRLALFVCGALLVPGIVAAASLTATPTSGTVPLTVNFTAESATTYAGGYQINYGDSTSAAPCTTGPLSCPKHTYTKTGTFTAKLEGKAQGGALTTVATRTITVNAPSSAPTCTLTATPPNIVIGDRSRLEWRSQGASRGTLTVVGNISANGSVYVTPSKTTDYTATFTGAGGTGTCVARVTVGPLGSQGGGSGAGGGSGGGNNDMYDELTLLDNDLGIVKQQNGSYKVPLPQSGSVQIGESATLNPDGSYTIEGGTTSAVAQPVEFSTPSGEVITLNPDGSYTITAALPEESGTEQGGSQTASGPTQVGAIEVDTGGFPSSGSITLPPVSTTGGGFPTSLVPEECKGTNAVRTCDFCALVQLLQNIINWLLAISVLITAIMFAYAGVLFFTSAGSTTRVAKAKSIFTSVALGFFFALGGWLLVQTVMSALIDKKFFPANIAGSWNQLDCTKTRAARQIQISQSVSEWIGSSLPGLSTGGGGGVSVSTCPTGYRVSGNICTNNDGDVVLPNINDQRIVFGQHNDISTGIDAYTGASTREGPGGGNVACAWAVNNVLNSAGIASIDGNSVANMEQQLLAGRGDLVTDNGEARRGDIIVWKGINDNGQPVSHVGFCSNAGCTETISNSSPRATFDNVVTGSTFNGVPGRIYRVR